MQRTAALIALIAVAPGVTAQADSIPNFECHDRPATIVGTPGDDRLIGTEGRDVIVGRGGNDVIIGHDGRDRLCGDGGDDSLQGRYGKDLIIGGPGQDVGTGGPSADLLLGGEGRDRLSGGDGRASDTLVGGDANDVLRGGDGQFDQDYLFGAAGNDYLYAGVGGTDFLFGGEGNDYLGGEVGDTISYEFATGPVTIDMTDPFATVASGEGLDSLGKFTTVVGTRFSDSFIDGDASRQFRGGRGNDSITAGGGDDKIDGGPGNDTVDGGAGKDQIQFTDAAAGVTVDLAAGSATGAGSDSFTNIETVEGSYFDDHLTGTSGPDSLRGSYGTNTILALDGNDYIEFADAGDAGPGDDECIWASIEDCELNGHFDPAWLPYISDPEHQQAVAQVQAVRGAIAFGIAGPSKLTILVGIRRMTPDGCGWWVKGAFILGGCGTPIVNVVEPNDANQWELRVAEELPAGSYKLSARWKARSWRKFNCIGAFAPMCIEFSIPN